MQLWTFDLIAFLVVFNNNLLFIKFLKVGDGMKRSLSGRSLMAGLLVGLLLGCGGAESPSGGGLKAESPTMPSPVDSSGAKAGMNGLLAVPEAQEGVAIDGVRKQGGALNGSAATSVFVDELAPNERVTALVVCAGSLVDSITVQTNTRTLPKRGGSGGACATVHLMEGEQILRMSGLAFSGANGAIRQLTFQTSSGRTFGPYGAAGAQASDANTSRFSSTIAHGMSGRFKGFSGFQGVYAGFSVITQINMLDDSAGGRGGAPFIERLRADETLKTVTICYRPDAFVHSIQMRTSLGLMPKHGTDWPGLPCQTTEMAEGEYIVRLFGSAGNFVDSLGFATNKGRQFGPWGGTGGAPFEQVSDAGRFVGLFGRSGSWLDQIGLMQPGAGTGAWNFMDRLPSNQTVSHVQVCTGSRDGGDRVLHSLQVLYDNGRKKLALNGGWFKPNDTQCQDIALAPNEFIVEASGTHDQFITSVAFRTNQGRLMGPYGDGRGRQGYLIRNPNASQFMGFVGRTDGSMQKRDGHVMALDFAAPDVYPLVKRPDASAAQMGWWDNVVPWPVMGIHSAVLADGSVMTYGSGRSGLQGSQFEFDIWSPWLGVADPSHLTLPNGLGTDIFCGGQSLLSSGKVLIAGGDNRGEFSKLADASARNGGIKNTSIYDPLSKSLTEGAPLMFARWYATQVTLPSGRILVAGGTDENYQANDTPEIYTPGQGWRLLKGMKNMGAKAFYPRIFTTSWTKDGDQAFQITPDSGKIFRLNPDDNNGQGAIVDTGVSLPGPASWGTPSAQIAPNTVLLALDSGETVIVSFPWTEGAKPTIVPAGRMKQSRIWGNFTVLPTGEVLANGGALPNLVSAADMSTYAEIWSPKTKAWRIVSSEMRPRAYHSSALLLADGRVLSSGGGAPETAGVNNLNSQIFSPPYFFQANGAPSSRPVIARAPAQLKAFRNQRFAIETAQAADIQRVTLVKLSSVTHSFNSEQRFIELAFQKKDARTLSVSEPWDWYIAPPGFYMLSIIDRKGVPSASKIIRIER